MAEMFWIIWVDYLFFCVYLNIIVSMKKKSQISWATFRLSLKLTCYYVEYYNDPAWNSVILSGNQDSCFYLINNYKYKYTIINIQIYNCRHGCNGLFLSVGLLFHAIFFGSVFVSCNLFRCNLLRFLQFQFFYPVLV